MADRPPVPEVFDAQLTGAMVRARAAGRDDVLADLRALRTRARQEYGDAACRPALVAVFAALTARLDDADRPRGKA